MCQRLEKIYINSVNKYFPNGQCMMLQNNACEKELFKMQGQIRDFYVTEIKMFVDKLSDSTLML